MKLVDAMNRIVKSLSAWNLKRELKPSYLLTYPYEKLGRMLLTVLTELSKWQEA